MSSAAAGANHLFYPLPHQEPGSLAQSPGSIWANQQSNGLLLWDNSNILPAPESGMKAYSQAGKVWSQPWYFSYWLLPLTALSLVVLLLVIWRARREHQQNLHLKQAVFRKTAKIELQKKQLYACNKQLQQILHIRQNFVAQLCHELRTPLMLNLGLVKKVLETSRGEDKAQLDIVAGNIERCLHLAEQLLARDALAFVEPDTWCEQRVSPIVQASCLSWQAEAEQKDIVLCFEDEASGLSVKMAPYHLEIMIGNLLSNALKYTARHGCITVAIKHLNHKLVVTVSDTGKGMSKDIRDNIFNRYYKEDGDYNLAMGFGLGLSTVKQLVERYAGDISVVSYQGVGSEFILTLPAFHDACGSPPASYRNTTTR